MVGNQISQISHLIAIRDLEERNIIEILDYTKLIKQNPDIENHNVTRSSDNILNIKRRIIIKSRGKSN